MASSDAPRSVTRCELLRIREGSWRRKLAGVSLVAEYTEARVDHTEQALGALGHLFMGEYGAERRALLARYPAVQVLATTHVATEHYEAGSFWRALCEIARIPNNGPTQQEWGTAFLSNLEQLGLPTFEDVEDPGARFVGRILMHSGVPTFCLGDYFLLASERRRITPGLQPEEFVAWAAAKAQQGQLFNIDKPVQRFLRYGGEFAQDVTDRVFELLDDIRGGGGGAGIPLPARFAQAAQALHSEGALAAPARGSGRSGQGGVVQPQLFLDVHGGGLVLRLPAIGDTADGTVTWLVNLDGREQSVASSALWPGFHEPAPQVDVPIPRPIRIASAALVRHENAAVRVPVVDDADPLLVFEEDGRAVHAGVALPGGRVWLLHPRGGELDVDGELRELASAPLPPGWLSWRLVLVDLSSVRTLRLGEGSPRQVRTFAAARIVMPTPVASTRTVDGEPVYDSLPSIDLPDIGDQTWTISLHDEDETVVDRVQARDPSEAAEVWGSLEHPITGNFILRVRGPWGRSAVRRFTIVEGLRVLVDPVWRRMTGRGLVSCEGIVTVPPGVTAGPAEFHLGPYETRQPLIVDCGPRAFRMAVVPPHMSVSHVTDDGVAGPSVRALRMYTEGVLDDAGSLVLDVGADAEPSLHVLLPDGGSQLLYPKSAGRDQACRFDLREITDTLAAHRSLQLSLDAEGQLIVATIRPQQLASDITLDDGLLTFHDCAPVEGLTALCYLVAAPWRAPVALTVADGAAQLAEELRNVGPLQVSLRIEDPWVPEPLPVWPKPRTSRRVENDGWLAAGDADEIQLSKLLVGLEPLPDSFAPSPRAWETLDRLWWLGLEQHGHAAQDALRGVLRADPGTAFTSLASSNVETHRMPHVLIRSRLAWSHTDDASPDASAVDRRTVLALTLAGVWHHADEDALDVGRSVCGEALDALLKGRIPHPQAGRFDASADHIARLPEDRAAAIIAAANLMPHGLLDADERAAAAIRLFDNRRNEELRWLNRNAEVLLRHLGEGLRTADADVALAAVAARRHPTRSDGWRALPAWSMAVAMTARLVARGRIEDDILHPTIVRAWESLAEVSPDLVTIDLVIAELLVDYHVSVLRRDQ